MRKRVAISVLLFVFIIFSVGCSKELVKNEDVKYTLHIGLNDKNTYRQEISKEEAEKKVSEIALKYVDGFTQTEAKGAYKDDKGMLTYENNLVYTFDFATEEQIKSIMDEVLIELNQKAILIEKQKVNYDYYEGERNDTH